MAFTVYLGYTGKRLNSTLQPATSGMLPVSCELKEQSSMIRPTLILLPIAGSNIYEFNCAYIPTFGSRYYMISDIVWISGRYEIQLRVDVLATYKSAIGSSTQYVTRCSYTSNGNIKDTLYPITEQIGRSSYSLGTSARAKTIASGRFILGILSAEEGVGSVSYYMFTDAQFNAFKSALMSNLQWSGVTEISEELQKQLFNPYQYVTSCIWVPFSSGNWETVTNVKLGYWTFSQAAMRLDLDNTLPCYNAAIYAVPDANIPKHPQAATRGNYLNGPQFIRYYLRLTGYGTINLPNDIALLGMGFTIVESRDLITAESVLNIYAGTGNSRTTTPLMAVHGRYGVPIQLAQSTTDIVGSITSAANGLVEGIDQALHGNVSGGIKSAVNGAADALLSSMPNVQSSGINGSFVATLEFVDPSGTAINPVDTLEAVYKYIVDEDNSDLGRPLCASRQLSTIPGYILCVNGHVAGMASATDAEKEEVEQYLNTGFFYE